MLLTGLLLLEDYLRIDVVMFTLDASLGSEADALRTTRIIRSLLLGPVEIIGMN